MGFRFRLARESSRRRGAWRSLVGRGVRRSEGCDRTNRQRRAGGRRPGQSARGRPRCEGPYSRALRPAGRSRSAWIPDRSSRVERSPRSARVADGRNSPTGSPGPITRSPRASSSIASGSTISAGGSSTRRATSACWARSRPTPNCSITWPRRSSPTAGASRNSIAASSSRRRIASLRRAMQQR